ncbi:hypothetical protein TUM4438_19230 [Shewanella sairae]|uniref:Uncharacterized protein n=2 Tax=Shewanella sairae TaxID=190310 RepID=A0ABQ4PDB8_9GAMM|nr:hypothetical protein TUM4438_19230 [Shewanella sairae]
MALRFNVFALPDEHIQFLQLYPLSIEAYLLGKQPSANLLKAPAKQAWRLRLARLINGKKSQQIPVSWPSASVEMIGPNVSHRNVDIYHYILNNTENRVKGAGSLFQTWIDINDHDAIKMAADGESFAFKSHDLCSLQPLLTALNAQTIRSRFDAWLLIHNPDYVPQESEYQEITSGIATFSRKVTEAIDKKLGLMWVTQ